MGSILEQLPQEEYIALMKEKNQLFAEKWNKWVQDMMVMHKERVSLFEKYSPKEYADYMEAHPDTVKRLRKAIKELKRGNL